MKPPSGVIGVEGLEIQRVAAVSSRGGEVELLTPEKLHVYEFDWSPDSKKLAYIAAQAAGREQLVGGAALHRAGNAECAADQHRRPAKGFRIAARPADRGAPLVAGRHRASPSSAD